MDSEGTGGEIRRLERKLDELVVELASVDVPDELVALLASEIEATKEHLRRALEAPDSTP